MTLRLDAIDENTDPAAFAEALAPGFGGDTGPAREILEQTVGLLTRDPRPHPWVSYLAADDAAIVGICAFKTAPDAQGAVELAYMTFPGFEGRGHATVMISTLLETAAKGGAATAVAHTLPEVNPSNRALLRNGFAFAGDVMDSEDGLVWRWERPL